MGLVMSSTVDKVIDHIDTATLFAKSTEWLATVTADHGPAAVEVALAVARVSALQEVIWLLVSISALIFGLILASWGVRSFKRSNYEEEYLSFTIIGGFISLFATVPVFTYLKIAPIIGVFYPDFYIAWMAWEAIK